MDELIAKAFSGAKNSVHSSGGKQQGTFGAGRIPFPGGNLPPFQIGVGRNHKVYKAGGGHGAYHRELRPMPVWGILRASDENPSKAGV